ncbi:hypothetical protein [Phormidium sp. CCY1219]|jgi:hypothetical protein|uniref:hypothetical protein n=1 Tax=Phormidium sp. CCY1219 TaxID=2886104 RepID=UPI002D1F661E|nr:hypothetical protein [Phormidium sp. CCY1219]MEB3828583.1 hypothetical protein [Phormidium sp. CCY1219]
MLPKEFPQITPTPQNFAESLQAAQVTREFYEELEYREEFENYCQWYRDSAECHRRELEKMRGDINILGWFSRGKR